MRFIGIFVSLMALCVSALTFWLTQLQPARVDIFVSPSIYLGKDNLSGREYLWNAVALSNAGATTAVVYDVTLTITRDDGASKSFTAKYHMDDESGGGTFIIGKPFSPITILGDHVDSQVLAFYPTDQTDFGEIVSSPGTYRFDFVAAQLGRSPLSEPVAYYTVYKFTTDDIQKKKTDTSRGNLYLFGAAQLAE
ncbi:MAG: hypothetical protein AAF511_07770 [Pseudomonadota bacterium]